MRLIFNCFQSLCFVLVLVRCSFAFTIPFKVIEDSNANNCSTPFISFLQYNSPLAISNYLFLIEANIGSPPQKIILKLGSRTSGIWIRDHNSLEKGYDKSISNTYTVIESNVLDFFGQGEIGKEKVVIADIDYQINNFPFLLIQIPSSSLGNPSYYAGEFNIGLDTTSRNSNSDKYPFAFNLLDYLYENHEIDQRLVVLSINNKSSGSITIGKYPIGISFKQLKECPVKINQIFKPSWSCMLNAVYFSDNKLFPVNQIVDVSMGENAVMVSQTFFNELIENYFKEDINSKKCYLSKFWMLTGVCCEKDYDENKIGVISFVFGKWTLKLESNSLFRYDKRGIKCLRMIMQKNMEAWYFSPSVLMNYYTFFNMDTQKVGFYPKK